MSIRQGTKLIAGTSKFRPDLFDWKWTDHILNDPQWLRTDTFSWQDGGVYEVAYNHLAADITGKTLQSETVAGTTVQFYLADDGHKICPASEESNVSAIYSATGVAWYYIVDTTNQRFKLPRTKFGVTGLRDTVGNYVSESVPNITGDITSILINHDTTTSGALSIGTKTGNFSTPGGAYYRDEVPLLLDASNSSSVYQNDAPVQERATQMYLYFYVGSFTQTALENTAGINTEDFNDKADTDFGNTNMIDYVVEKQDPTAGNNYTWYRKYASGWVEQGGYYYKGSSVAGNNNITFPIEMADINYTVLALQQFTAAGQGYVQNEVYTSRTTTGFVLGISSGVYGYNWQVSGVAA